MTQLNRLLDDGLQFDAEYDDGLTNHLPMALIALHRLGASDDRLDSFAKKYAKRLVPAPSIVLWPDGKVWNAELGNRDAWSAYRSLFRAWLAKDGQAAVLAQTLPTLMRGCGAAAFHGMIRGAYAVEALHLNELADALAYWACRHLVLGAASNGTENNPRILLDEMAVTFADWSSTKPLIFLRMSDIAQVPAFCATAQRLRVDENTLPFLAQYAAQLYGASGNFTALHLVTSAHAMRVLLKFVDAPQEAVERYWTAFAAGFVASKLQPRQAVVAAAGHRA